MDTNNRENMGKVIIKKNNKKIKTRVAIISKPFTKADIIEILAKKAKIQKKQALTALDALTAIIHAHLIKKNVGVFTLPGIAKFKTTRKLAVKSRKAINPFTGEMTTYAAKPAHNIVKIKPLKKLKDIIF